MKSEKFYTSYSKLSEIKLITIGIASTELIKYWAEKTLPNGKVLGEVINPNTLHHKSFKPLKGGLFCERIFGPLKDFECACGKKPFMSKKEKGFSLEKNELIPFGKEGDPFLGTTESSCKGVRPEIMKSLKLNRIYNKTKSIFGSISSKTRKYCLNCEVEYTWSVIRRYQLGYINLIAPVTHIWYLKGTPSYLSILLDFKKRDLVSVIYCTATLTIENILKGSIPTLKSADIVSSWKNLKKQISSQRVRSFTLEQGLHSHAQMGGNNNLNLEQSSLYKISSSFPLVDSKIKRRKMLKLTKKFNFVSPSFTRAEDRDWDPSCVLGFVPPPPLWEGLVPKGEGGEEKTKGLIRDKSEMIFNNQKKNAYPINFTKLKILSKLLIESKHNSLKFSTLSSNGFFPKNVLKRIRIDNYILLYLNVFSENKIWLTSIEIAWDWLVKKAYKTIILRIQQISKKFDYLQVKPTEILNSIKLKKDNHLLTYSPNKSSIFKSNYWNRNEQNFVLKKQIYQSTYNKIYNNSLFASSKKKFLNLIMFVFGINSFFSVVSPKGFISSHLNSSEGNQLKKTNKTNHFYSFQPIELYTFSSYSTSKIYYLRSKILSQSFLKKINSLFNKNNLTLTNLLSFREGTIPKEIKKRDLLGDNDFSKDQRIKWSLNLGLQSEKNEFLSKYLEIFNSLLKLFLKNLLNEGSFKSTVFKRYFEYSVLQFCTFPFVPKGTGPKDRPEAEGMGTNSFSSRQKGTNQLKKSEKKLIPALNKNKSNIGLPNIKENVKTFLIQVKRFVSIAYNLNLNLSSVSEKISWKRDKSRLINHFSFEKLLVFHPFPLKLKFRSDLLNMENKKMLIQKSIATRFTLDCFGTNPFKKEQALIPRGTKINPFEEGKVLNVSNKRHIFYSLLKKFYSFSLVPSACSKGTVSFSGKGRNSLEKNVFKKIINKIQIKKDTNKLYNNLYCLSYRELWPNDNDWSMVYYYLFPPTDHSKIIIPSYQTRYPNAVRSFTFGTSPVKNGNNYNQESNSLLLREGRNNSFSQKESFFSGSFVIQKLLQEYPLNEIKQIDRQNRILLYQLNKQIVKIKPDKSLAKDLKKCYRTRDLLIRRTKVIRKIFRKDSTPESLILSVLPVLPPDLRPIVKMGNQIAASDLNRLYQRIIYRNERLKNFLKDSATSNSFEMKYAQRLLQEAVDNLIQNGKSGNGSEKDSRGRLLKSLSDLLKGKQGRFRQYLLGKRVDYSGRSVIVVGPKLKLHECGLPKEIALELYLPFLLKRMLNQNVAQTIIGAKMLIKTNPGLIYELLREIMQTSPILLNRAPTLHRLGIQAFQPILIEGRAILLHPLVCSAFNADFDGDQMAVHVPITVEARAEAWKLMLSRNNILAPSTGDPLAIPSQDMVLGCYYLTTNLLNSKINYSLKKRGSGLFFTKINHVEKAYELKKLDLHANIWLKWSGLVENGLDQEEPIEIRIDSSGKWKEILNKYQKNYSFNNLLQNTYILTTVGRVIFNIKIQNCLDVNS